MVRSQVVLRTLSDFKAMNRVYSGYFPSGTVKPARTTFQAGDMPKGSSVEIDVIAVVEQ